MFKTKKTELFSVKEKKPVAKKAAPKRANSFLTAGRKQAAVTQSYNGALKYSSNISEFVTQFNNLGTYKEPRSYDAIAKDMSTLYAIDPLNAVKFTIFMRIISRNVDLWGGEKTSVPQKGAGLKHEPIVRMIWLAINHPQVFWLNFELFVAAGSWKDVIEMLSLDLQYHNWDDKVLNWPEMAASIIAALENPGTSELMKKYLPQIKAKSKCTTVQSQADTMIGKYLASQMDLTYEGYRKLKSSGTAHTWQQLISKKLMSKIDFNTVHGRALSALVSGKFLKNNGLETIYTKWIESKPIAKFTGYVHELTGKIAKSATQYQLTTLNKQYEGLIQLAKTNANINTGFIVVRDTSASMGSIAQGTTMSCGNIAKSLAIYFSDMLEGPFKNHWIEFHSTAEMRVFKGATLVEKWNNDHAGYVGSTNFLAVADVLIMAKRAGASLSDFPTGILCISDGEFNPAQLGKSNVETFLNKLRAAGFPKDYVDNFKIALWNIHSRHGAPKFETFDNVPNVFYMSGYAAEILQFLLGDAKTAAEDAPKNAEELFAAAMNQELLDLVVV